MTNRMHITRRGLLVAGGAAIVGAVGGCSAPADEPSGSSAGTASGSPPPAAAATSTPSGTTLAFHGAHQAGVETPRALHQSFVGLDLIDPTPANIDAVLRLVSDDAARMMQGEPALGDTEPELASVPAGLTVTIGIGRQALQRAGLADRIPEQLVDLPPFRTDRLERRWGQTDLLLQIGSDDAVTLTHTVRMLTKDLSTLTTVTWIQPGFSSATPAVPGGSTTRNLMGQVDGTVNPASGTDDFADVVWIDGGEPWVDGGTILVLRRIRMLLDTWQSLDRVTQESVIGRHLATGAPLGGETESDSVQFDAVDENGLPVIPADAHVRVAHASTPAERILRRPYSYDNGMVDGTNDVGLLFAAYTRDPSASFIPMQTRIAEQDAFNRWNTTIGSAVYFIPAGAPAGGYVGEGFVT
jgi:dye decolorizing peroxidase